MVNIIKPTVLKPTAPAVANPGGVNLIPPTIIGAGSTYGTYGKLFAPDSPWNSYPVNPVLDMKVGVPKSDYFPAISDGAYSTGVFEAKASDHSVIVYPPEGSQGVSSPDDGGFLSSVAIPRWPASVVGATGTDGHADIFDDITGIIHSFWQLRQDESGRWSAAMYTWSMGNGTGWGDPAHAYQGARATGVPTSAGIIRLNEIDDGAAFYGHALAMSLAANGLAGGDGSEAYVWPATSADNGSYINSGAIPEGALLMLPASYDTSKLPVALKKIAETLKRFGARVVDRNTGTPYVIYVENAPAGVVNPPSINLMPNGWDNNVAAALDDIRANLHPVKSSDGFIGGDGKRAIFDMNQNVLSMRGPWDLQYNSPAGKFYSLGQVLNFSASTAPVTQFSTNGPTSVKWAALKPGVKYDLSLAATGGAYINFTIYAGSKLDSNATLKDGGSKQIVWPEGGWMIMQAVSGAKTASSVKARMVIAS